MMDFIPDEIQSLPREIEQDAQKCYLAKVLDKTTFTTRYKNLKNVDYSRAMKEIADRISRDQPPTQGSISWHLAKQLLIGALRIFIYILINATAKGDRMVAKVGSLSDKKEVQDLPPVIGSFSTPEEAVDGLPDLQYLPCQDAHQIHDLAGVIKSRYVQKPCMTHFASDPFDTLEVGETETLGINFLEEGLSDGGIITAITNTPKRKAAEMGEDDIRTFGTPAKHPRRNLEAEFNSYDTPRDEGANASLPAIHDTLPQADLENNQEVINELHDTYPDEMQPQENTRAPESEITPENASPDIVEPIIPRAHVITTRTTPRAETMSTRKITRVMGNVNTGAVPQADYLGDGKKNANSTSTLFNHSQINWTIDGYAPRGDFVEDYLKDMMLFDGLPRGENEFDGIDLRSFENMMASHEISVALNVDGEQTTQQEEVTLDREPHIEQEEIAMHESSHHVSPPVETSDLPPPMPSPEEAESWTRLPQVKRIRGRRAEFLIDIDEERQPLNFEENNSQIYNLLRRVWQEKKNANNLEVDPPIAFDEFVKPSEVTIDTYTMTLKSCMNSMRADKLRMKQSAPYGTMWLYPQNF